MTADKDFISFVDSGSKVPYFSTNGKYTTKPNVISIQFDYEFKTYYKSYNHYFVGVGFSRFVRFIYPDEFKMMLALFNERESLKEKLTERVQLVFEL